MNNHIIMVTGLGSSLPWIGRIWTVWARKLEKRFETHYKGRKDVKITRVSADGKGEAAALNLLRRDKTKGTLGKVAIIGHSNGFRDGLNMAATIKADVDYFAGIDMTLGEFGAEATNNIQLFHEFRAVYGTKENADFAKDFDMSKYKQWSIRNFHTAAASDKFVQATIFNTIKGIIQ